MEPGSIVIDEPDSVKPTPSQKHSVSVEFQANWKERESQKASKSAFTPLSAPAGVSASTNDQTGTATGTGGAIDVHAVGRIPKRAVDRAGTVDHGGARDHERIPFRGRHRVPPADP